MTRTPVAVNRGANDTPTAPEIVVRSLAELKDLLGHPRTAGEPLQVQIEGPAAAGLFGVGVTA